MIVYSPGKWHVLFIFALKGSVFPKGVAWGTPSAMLAIVWGLLVKVEHGSVSSSLNMLWSGYSFVLGFLIVFRTQQAYSRFWEGTTLLHKVRATWFNAVSSLFAFCTTAKDRRGDVECFQQLIVRLMSLLFCSALQQVAELKDERFEILDQRGVQSSCLDFLQECGDMKLDVIMQWIQKLIVLKMEDGVLPIPPPVLSRVFQELSNGIVDLKNAQKLTDMLFPFPYAQMVTTMLLIATVFTPIIAGTVIESYAWAGCLSFVWVFSFWSINYIAAEIELPFGDDANDVPVAEIQKSMNRSLQLLLYPQAQAPPKFAYDSSLKVCGIVRCQTIDTSQLFAPENLVASPYENLILKQSQQDVSLPLPRAEWLGMTEHGLYSSCSGSALPSPRSPPEEQRKLDSAPQNLHSSHDTLESPQLASSNESLRPTHTCTDVKDRLEVVSFGSKERVQLRTEAKDLSDSTFNIEPKIAACLRGIEELLGHIVHELETISTFGERLAHTKGVAEMSESQSSRPPQRAALGERLVRPHDSLDPDPDLSLAMRL